jgi:hypothetical protein
MKQVLHIFRKDTRRFWPEIVVSLAVVAGLVYVSPYTWRGEFAYGGHSAVRAGLVRVVVSLPLLVVASWGILITRVIHAESLVGDTQFWVTRPYDWKKLLAAKVLFLAVYLYLPLAVAQWTMLALAGFHPQWHVAGLLYSLLLITEYLVLPCVALASVTLNMARMVLTLLAVLACFAGFVACAYFGIVGTVNGVNLPDANLILRVALPCLCIAAIGVQYATRRTWVARILLLSLPVCVFAIGELLPINTVDRVYAQPNGAADAIPALTYSPTEGEKYGAVARSDKQISFGVPIEATGLPDKTILAVDDVKIAMQASDGTRWVSPWEGSSGIPASSRGVVYVALPPAIYASFLGKPLTVHLTLAISQGQSQGPTSIRFPFSEAPVAGDGICSARSRLSEGGGYSTQNIDTRCRFPLRTPFTRVAMLTAESACKSGGENWTGSLTTGPAQLAIDPIWPGANFSTGQSYTSNGVASPLPCPAIGVTFTQYRLERRTQASLTIEGYQLPGLSAGQQ